MAYATPPSAVPGREPKYAEAMARAQTTLDAELGTAGNNWSSPPVLQGTTGHGMRTPKDLPIMMSLGVPTRVPGVNTASSQNT